MKPLAYCLFETALGWCGIAWSERGNRPAVTYLQLPEATREVTESRLARDSGARPSSAPPEISRLIERLRKHLQGDIQDFRDVAVDLEGRGSSPGESTRRRARFPPARLVPTARLPRP
jgi:hypothetical protein